MLPSPFESSFSFCFWLLLLFSKLCNCIINPPVTCHGPVPEISKGKYYFHDNGTYLLRISTRVQLKLDLNQRSCFQVNIFGEDSNENNETSKKVASLFYALKYTSYQQTYDIRTSYQFGIAELQSYCKCDCPGGENFCNHEFGRKECSKGEICVTRYHGLQDSKGCPNQGAASLCCEISVQPYQDRRLTAINLVDPQAQTKIEIEIYTLYQQKWSLFRRYRRTIVPYRANSLRLNGYENVAEMYIRANSENSRFYLKNGDKYYFYEDTLPFRLLDDIRINSLFERDPAKFGWLRFEDGQWTIGDALSNLYNLQQPLVTDCRRQKYTDRYRIDFEKVVVVRNSSGAINAEPYLGTEVSAKPKVC